MEAHIIFNRRHHTTLIIQELPAPVPKDEFGWKVEEAIKTLLDFLHPFCLIRISSVSVEDIPRNIGYLLQHKVGRSLAFEIKTHFGYRRKRLTPSAWSKKIRRPALIRFGTWSTKDGFIPYEYVFCRYSFKRLPAPTLLSWTSSLYHRWGYFFIKKACLYSDMRESL